MANRQEHRQAVEEAFEALENLVDQGATRIYSALHDARQRVLSMLGEPVVADPTGPVDEWQSMINDMARYQEELLKDRDELRDKVKRWADATVEEWPLLSLRDVWNHIPNEYKTRVERNNWFNQQ